MALSLIKINGPCFLGIGFPLSQQPSITYVSKAKQSKAITHAVLKSNYYSDLCFLLRIISRKKSKA